MKPKPFFIHSKNVFELNSLQCTICICKATLILISTYFSFVYNAFQFILKFLFFFFLFPFMHFIYIRTYSMIAIKLKFEDFIFYIHCCTVRVTLDDIFYILFFSLRFCRYLFLISPSIHA